MVTPIIKFNGGIGAILCNKCKVIVKEHLTKDEIEGRTDILYCEECKNNTLLLPKVPEKCMICDARWIGGCERPGHRFPRLGVRVFYECGASLSIIDRPKELSENFGESYWLRFKGCNEQENRVSEENLQSSSNS